jgi:tetratricopeptide (TPR) repeat protein
MASKKPSVNKRPDVKLWIYYAIIGTAAFLVYWNALSNDFVFDDESVVLGDPTITSLSNIPKYFTAQEGFHKVIGRYFRPVISTSYAIDYALYGLKPFGYHLTNVIIHVINSLLFYYLLLLIFNTVKPEKQAFNLQYILLFAALLFAVHPIHTEAISWVSGRTDSLSFTFFLISFIFYLKYSAKSKTSLIVLSLVSYILSLLAKEMSVTLPALIILFDFIVLKLSWDNIKKKIPVYSTFVVLTILYLFFRYLVLKDVPQRETYFYFYDKDSITVILTMLQTIPLYFRLLIVPVGLLYHYNGYLPFISSFADFNVIFSLIFILFMLAAAFYFYKKIPLVSFGILFFFISLLPVLNIVPTMNFMAERFLYSSSISLSLFGAAFWLQYYSAKNKNFISVSFALVILIFSYLTISRNIDWKNNDTLFLSADGKPGVVTYVNIGNIFANNNQVDKAEIYYRKAIDLKKESVLANNNLGKVFLVRDNFDSAYFYMNRARLADTLSPEPLLSFAQLYAKRRMLKEAIASLEKIQTLTPNYMNSAEMLANLKMQEKTMPPDNKPIDGETSRRIAALQKESFSLYQEKQYEKSISELEELVKLEPSGKAGYLNNMAMCYKDWGKIDKAKESLLKAIEADKNFATAYNNLGDIYQVSGDKIKAKEYYKKALELDPNNQNAKQQLELLK